jgi:nucleotide-binding universal stress UspA family protein
MTTENGTAPLSVAESYEIREESDRPVSREGFVVLLPVLDLEETRRLLPISSAIAAQQGGRVTVLGVVEVPSDEPLSQGVVRARHLRTQLDGVAEFRTQQPVQVRSSVRVAYAMIDAIHAAVEAEGCDVIVMGWQEAHSSPERLFGPPIDLLLRVPPCDVVVVKLGSAPVWRHILLPVRGGPHTQLACETAIALAELSDGDISVLYAANRRQPDSPAVRESLQSLRQMPRVQRWLERTIPAEQAIMAEAPDHQAIVLGVSGRRNDPEPVGLLADRVMRKAPETVVLVRHRMDRSEEQAQQIWQQKSNLSATVDGWFAENTFSSEEFADLQRLLMLKQQLGVTISLGLPTLNEEETIGAIIEQVKSTMFEEVPLLDEIVLIDSRSTDRTREIAEQHGIAVHVHQDILPQYGSFHGKGEALRKSLYVLKGDIIAWVDTDIKNFHPRFVYGILGPLLREPKLRYSKGFYRRPIMQADELIAAGGGRVTELTARPLFNLFFPELSGMVQPLSGEYAGRREALERMPFFTGYGVETGLLIDLLEAYGLGGIAQVDLQQRIHRNQALVPLSKMAFAIIQVVIQRLEQRHRLYLLETVNQSMKLIQYAADEGFHLEVREIRDHERPAMNTIPEYRQLRGLPPM